MSPPDRESTSLPKILHLIKGLGKGGAETLLVDGLAVADRRRFHYRYGYFLPWKDALVPRLTELGADVVPFRRRHLAGMLLSVPAVVSELRRSKVDLLHSHLPLSGVIGRLAGRLAGVPVVYTEHNVLERYHPATRALHLATWSLQSRVTAVSAEVLRSIRRLAPDEVPAELVLNGIPSERFRADPERGRRQRRELGIPPGVPVVGAVTVFRPQKRLDLWLDAAVRIRHRIPEARFLLVGHGPLAERIDVLARESGLGEALVRPGLQDDVRSWIDAMDVFLMSSDFEGLPLALLEAMAMERPVVATTVGGIPEVVDSGRHGVLVPPGRSDRLAEEVVGLLADRGRARRLAVSACRRVEADFSIGAMVRRFESIYTEVLRA